MLIDQFWLDSHSASRSQARLYGPCWLCACVPELGPVRPLDDELPPEFPDPLLCPEEELPEEELPEEELLDEPLDDPLDEDPEDDPLDEPEEPDPEFVEPAADDPLVLTPETKSCHTQPVVPLTRT